MILKVQKSVMQTSVFVVTVFRRPHVILMVLMSVRVVILIIINLTIFAIKTSVFVLMAMPMGRMLVEGRVMLMAGISVTLVIMVMTKNKYMVMVIRLWNVIEERAVRTVLRVVFRNNAYNQCDKTLNF